MRSERARVGIITRDGRLLDDFLRLTFVKGINYGLVNALTELTWVKELTTRASYSAVTLRHAHARLLIPDLTPSADFERLLANLVTIVVARLHLGVINDDNWFFNKQRNALAVF